MGKVIDYSLIELTPAEESHREFGYQIKKAAYRGYVEEIWGWDEKVAREHHNQDWQDKTPQVILYSNNPIGTIYVKEENDYIEIEQFILSSEYQNQGIGSRILKGIINRADRTSRVIKLMYLRINPVASLYRRMGFKIVGNDDTFISVERRPMGTA
jgi:GNAT superfamily N-acetyltransferase